MTRHRWGWASLVLLAAVELLGFGIRPAAAGDAPPPWAEVLLQPTTWRPPQILRDDEQRLPPNARVSVRAFLERQGKVEYLYFESSPNGKSATVIYSREEAPIKYHMVVATGSAIRPLPSLPDGFVLSPRVAWRPDSSAIAVAADRSRPQGGPDDGAVYLWELKRSVLKRLADFPAAHPYWLAWDRHGKALAVLVTTEEQTGHVMHGNAFLVESRGRVVQLTTEYQAVSPAWSSVEDLLAVGDESWQAPRIMFFDSTGQSRGHVDLRPHLTFDPCEAPPPAPPRDPTRLPCNAYLLTVEWLRADALRIQMITRERETLTGEWWYIVQRRK